MKRFVKLFGRQAVRQTATEVEYRGFQDLDNVHAQAVRLLTDLGIQGYTIRKEPRLRGFIITF